jgi:two-component system response regulator VanR
MQTGRQAYYHGMDTFNSLQEIPEIPTHTILLVDDDHFAREFHAGALIASGFDVDTAEDGAEGWQKIQAKKYDLIITDNTMPKMTGIEMVEKLRSARMAVPVIMATRTLPTFEIARNPWLKPDAALIKPFAFDALLATVKQVLRTST